MNETADERLDSVAGQVERPVGRPAPERNRTLSDELMDCVDRLGSEWPNVDPRVWDHLLVYAPAGKIAARCAQLHERNDDERR